CLLGSERIPACYPHLPIRTLGVLLSNLERNGNDRIKLDDIGNIVNEGQRLTGMNKPDCRRIACSENSRFSDTIETRSSCAQTLVDHIARVPVIGVVAATIPLYPILFCEQTIELPYAGTFNPTELIHAPALGGFLTKTQLKHLAYHFEP